MWSFWAALFLLMNQGMGMNFNQRFIKNIKIESTEDLQKIYPNNPFFKLVTKSSISLPHTTTTTSTTVHHDHHHVRHDVPKTLENSVNTADICGKTVNKPNSLIVNGLRTNEGDWPWIAAVFLRKHQNEESKFICGGNLISKLHILTAGHCFLIAPENTRYLANANAVEVYLGVHDIRRREDPNIQLKKVERIILHPDLKYGPYSDADIALLEMTSPAEYTLNVRPICLWKGTTDLTDIVGKKGTVIGWGRSELEDTHTNVPQLIDLPIVSQEECRQSDPRFEYLTSPRTFCAGLKNGSGPCNGDSGNGLILRLKDNNELRWFLRGITSSSLLDKTQNILCNLKQYVIFIDVAKFELWLKQFLPQE